MRSSSAICRWALAECVVVRHYQWIDSCSFCDLDHIRSTTTFTLDNELCLFAADEVSTNDGLLHGSGVIIPKAHRETVFDLSPAEAAATHELLQVVRMALDARLSPDGYTVGWNCYAASGQTEPHAHLHVIPRFDDEPEAGKGLRWWLRQPDNRRADPTQPGVGSRTFKVGR